MLHGSSLLRVPAVQRPRLDPSEAFRVVCMFGGSRRENLDKSRVSFPLLSRDPSCWKTTKNPGEMAIGFCKERWLNIMEKESTFGTRGRTNPMKQEREQIR